MHCMVQPVMLAYIYMIVIFIVIFIIYYIASSFTQSYSLQLLPKLSVFAQLSQQSLIDSIDSG